jgi:hypothetical protein
MSARASSASGVAVAISNAARGIGDPGISSYRVHNPGVLKTVVVLYNDPWRDHGRSAGAFCLPTHELAHTWAAFLHLGLSAGGHWTSEFVRSRSAFGVDGECVFNDLELYLAGLIPPDSVTGVLTRSGLTIADVMAAEGSRLPQWPGTQRNFNVAFIVSAREPLSRVELAYFETIAREYGERHSPLGLTFEGATGGRATLNTRIPTPAQR